MAPAPRRWPLLLALLGAVGLAIWLSARGGNSSVRVEAQRDPLFSALVHRPLSPLLLPDGGPLPVHLTLGNHDVGHARTCAALLGEKAPAAARTKACLEVAHRGPNWSLPSPPQLIGLSATQKPIEELASIPRRTPRRCSPRPSLSRRSSPPASAGWPRGLCSSGAPRAESGCRPPSSAPAPRTCSPKSSPPRWPARTTAIGVLRSPAPPAHPPAHHRPAEGGEVDPALPHRVEGVPTGAGAPGPAVSLLLRNRPSRAARQRGPLSALARAVAGLPAAGGEGRSPRVPSVIGQVVAYLDGVPLAQPEWLRSSAKMSTPVAET